MTECDRCKRLTWVTTCSRFNVETICLTCEETEKEHELYDLAVRAEVDAVNRGEYNEEDGMLNPQRRVVSFTMDQDEASHLAMVAHHEDLTVSELVDRIVTAFLDRWIQAQDEPELSCDDVSRPAHR